MDAIESGGKMPIWDPESMSIRARPACGRQRRCAGNLDGREDRYMWRA